MLQGLPDQRRALAASLAEVDYKDFAAVAAVDNKPAAGLGGPVDEFESLALDGFRNNSVVDLGLK